MEFLVAEWICDTCGCHQVTWRNLGFCSCSMPDCTGSLTLLQGLGYKSPTEIIKLGKKVIANKTSKPTDNP